MLTRTWQWFQTAIPKVPESYFRERMALGTRRSWVMLLYVTLIYGTFYGLDVIVFPSHAISFGIMRMAIVAIALCGLAVGRLSDLVRYVLAITSFSLCTASISVMAVMTGGFASKYLVGVILCYVGGATIELFPPAGFATYATLSFVFHVVGCTVFGPRSASADVALCSFFLGGSVVMCSCAAVLVDEQRRRMYLLRVDLDAKNREVEARHQELVESYRQADRIFAALAEALEGTLLGGRYRLETRVGQGGFGAVYRALDTETNEAVAIKVFRPQAGNESLTSLERFRNEGISASRVSHKNAVNVLASGVSNEGIAYIVMELLEGRSLAEELREKGKLSVARSCEIARSVSAALAEAHRVGIVHRDVKPENIFLHRVGDDEIVKVVDFGAAKLRQGDDAPTATSTGIIGTPIYMAPERLDNRGCDGRSDVYSLGIVLYQMLVGHPPFAMEDGNVWSIVVKHVKEEPRAPVEIDPTIPVEVSKTCLLALAKSQDDRPSASDLATLLANLNARNEHGQGLAQAG